MTRPQWFYAGLLAAAAYAVLPLLLFNYNWPPGDDPGRLWGQLQGGIGVYRYYGHLPALVIGMPAYYWLTPVIVYGGLWLALSRYGWQTPLLAWGVLFLVARPLLFDLHAGTVVQQAAVFGLGFPLLALGEKRPALLVAMPLLVVVHTLAGVALTVAALGSLLWRREWRLAGELALAGAALILLSMTVLDSSANHLARLATGTRLVTETLPVLGFLSLYVGVGLWALWALTLLLAWRAWQEGWRWRLDGFQVGVLATALLLVIPTLTPWSTNADRTAKLLVEFVAIGGVIILADLMRHFWGKRVTWVIAVGLILVLAVTAPDLIPYWLGMGDYR